MYKKRIGKKLDFCNPQTFNEKIQWLKLYDRKPIYTTMVDKYEVKKFVASIIGDEKIVPTLGVVDCFDDIDFDQLPNQFVIKCTHDSGGLVICKGKRIFDIKAAKRKIEQCLNRNYFYVGREWPYKNVKRRILIEPYLINDSEADLKDYKFICFNGKVLCSFVCSERFSEDEDKVTFFDREWRRMPFTRHYSASSVEIEKPHNYEEMIKISEELAKEIPFTRIDFYEVDGKIYFGEITLYPGSGFEEFTSEEWDLTLENWLSLPKVDTRSNENPHNYRRKC